MRKGHSVKNNKIRKFDVPKGLVRWCPKAHLTLLDPSLIGYQNLKSNLFCKSVWHPATYYGIWTVDVPNI